MSKLPCPFDDGVFAEGKSRIKKHMMGRQNKYRGHEIPEYLAEIIARKLEGSELSEDEKIIVDEAIYNVKENGGRYIESKGELVIKSQPVTHENIIKEEKNVVDKIFNCMDRWRRLPKYRLESRADIFFAAYLETILSRKYGESVKIVVPEFPLRYAVDKNGDIINNPKNVDYLCVSEQSRKLKLVELKTDVDSAGDDQKKLYKKVQDGKADKLISDLVCIFSAKGKKKEKYTSLFQMLLKNRIITCKDNVLLSLFDLRVKLSSVKLCADISKEIEVCYITPQNICDDQFDNITFNDIINMLNPDIQINKEDIILPRFLTSLREWEKPV